jgi:uncharacterized tellurite resistance protein B-like protein
MAERKFVMDLAKLVIAAAWADGKMTNEETNALKDLLFGLEDVTGEEWAHLEVYMDSPVGPEERQKLLEAVLQQIKSEQDKALVVATLESLFEADGVVTDEERAFLDEIKRGVSEVNTGMLATFSKMIKAACGKRERAHDGAAQRDSQVGDYIENTIYYQLKSEGEKKGISIDLPEEKKRQLCLAAGLLARIAAVDAGISQQERQTIKQIVSEEWGLSEQQAQVVAEISCDRTLRGLDYFRLTRGFFECTSLDERRRFIRLLFKIANASEKTSFDETEEIRRIANSLKLSHQDFIDAKLTIPDEDRQVL